MTTSDFTLNATTTMPAVGFGTYLITNDQTPEAVKAAIETGYRHIDTAQGYQNEEGVGKGVRAGIEAKGLRREDIFVTTKLWPGNPAWGQEPADGPATLAAFENSLETLGFDYVDLYLIHAPYGGAHRIAEWEALLELKAQGRARAAGVSNFNSDHLDEIEAAGLPMPDANQVELHPWSQKTDLIGKMRALGIQPIAYSSLAPLSTWRSAPGQDSAKSDEMKVGGVDAPFQVMAQKYGVSEAQLLLRWGVQNGYAVLPKSLNATRMAQNLDLFSFEIDADDMATMLEMDRGLSIAWATGDPSEVD
ncbi:aldo/keto reductase [Boseongicola aestuarii]|uniref:Putative oxidoreductase/MSMEI_2347 n=1 Tax=Boseongicola aestuarii TaxID=1470561 RepID=A0A238J3Y1_9RHOB|nr:aldo/keto reductase [Boseongicola aestuarii]SMX24932.1 putative oxidoreductase/MSMEI_2347 [Boseongicola aestuarii]